MPAALWPKVMGLLIVLPIFTACSVISERGTELHNTTEPRNCEIAGKSFGIVGGEILSSDNDLSSSTVMVVHINRNDEVSTCTGTLIDSDKVISAAHCLTPDGKRTVIAFTNNASCLTKAPKRTLRLVTSEAIHPEYSYEKFSLNNAAKDLAILKFRGAIPEGYKVRALPSPSFTVHPNDTLVMTGYGTTIEGGDDSGTLRFTTTPATHLTPEFHIAFSKETVSVPGTWTVEQPHKGVCNGDSGGPLYAQNGQELTLIGITSLGVDHKTTDETKLRNCHGVALFTDIRSHLDWILRQNGLL